MDITKCFGGNCPLKETCKRYLAPASEFQSYLLDIPFQKINDEVTCTMYYENKNTGLGVISGSISGTWIP